MKVLLLGPFSTIYGLATFVRNGLYHLGLITVARAPLPVISVGNLTAGGTGKTPLCILLAEILSARGRRPAVLSRGYRRLRNSAEPLLVSDGRTILCPVEESGDEPALMARRLLRCGARVIVGRDRLRSAEMAHDLGADVAILDDGFQHRRIFRNLDILLLDYCRPWDNGWPLPAGMLREWPSSLKRADILILTRAKRAEVPSGVSGRLNPGTPIFFAQHRAIALIDWEHWQMGNWPEKGLRVDGPVLLFSGIARPDSFREMARDLGLEVSRHLVFPDHHHYRCWDLDNIERAASGLAAVVTTEKDAVRLPASWHPGVRTMVLVLEFSLGPGRAIEDLMTMVERKIQK